MSFWPFPKTLLDELRSGLAHGTGIDLGSGDGELAARLLTEDIGLFTCDLRGPASIRLDARRLPFGTSRLGAVLAANLLRHLEPHERVGVASECARSLAPGGRLVLLEDLPEGRNEAESNYRRALELLAGADPDRGAAISLDLTVSSLPAGLEPELDLQCENRERPRDVDLPLRWLAARGHAGSPDLQALEAAVRDHGMSYGLYRVCVFRRL
jgi:SAM-dependent methyltransferase